MFSIPFCLFAISYCSISPRGIFHSVSRTTGLFVLCLLSAIALGTRGTEERTIYKKNDYTLLSSVNRIHEVPWPNEAFFISIQSIYLQPSSSHSLFRKNNIEFSKKKASHLNNLYVLDIFGAMYRANRVCTTSAIFLSLVT